MSSDQAYVWIWLPGEVEPVVCGALKRHGDRYHFAYGASYLVRENAIPVYAPELPLERGEIVPHGEMAGCLRDASPDAWGRRVIMHRLTADKPQTPQAELGELTYLLESGSDRIGALDFQLSPTEYVPREKEQATLEELQEAADRIAANQPLTTALARAIQHGTSIGGARPKALIDDGVGERKYIAKFSTSTDLFNMVKGEYIAMRLAAVAKLDVAKVQLAQSAGRDVLLVERFDREKAADGWLRRAMVSALTIFRLDEMMARYASYELLAEEIRRSFARPRQTLLELYRRMVFNILVGNTDDHARNHAAFWDGRELALTPAYDICPQGRAGGEASQAMRIYGENNLSRLQTCIDAAPAFLLSSDEAVEHISNLVGSIRGNWEAVADEAELTTVEKRFFWGRQFLNPSIFDGLENGLAFHQ